MVVFASEGWVAHDLGWSSKEVVIGDGPSTWDGGACRIPQRVLCGGRVPPGSAATVHGILRKGEVGSLLGAYECRLFRPTRTFPRVLM